MENKVKKVVTLIKIDKDGNYEVTNWVADCKKEARQIVEAKVKEIREYWKDDLRFINYSMDEEPIKLTKEWVDTNKCHLYFYIGKQSIEEYNGCKIKYDFFIKDSEN